MKSRYQVALVGCCLTLGLGLVALAGDEKPAAGSDPVCAAMTPKCPVSGEPVDKKVFVEAGGMKVYFCCQKCEGKYKADPMKYSDKVHDQMICNSDKRVQVACPVSGKPVSKDASVDHHGTKIWFCCKDCIAPFEKDPAKYADKMVSCFTLQRKCPVGNEDINPASFVTLKDGHKVYFCCDKCKAKFDAEPAKYLEAMHMNMDEMKGAADDAAKKLMPGMKK